MTDQEPTVTITLDAREARALLGAASILGDVWTHLRAEDEHIARVTTSDVAPIQSAAMKLELALIQSRVDP